jgi:hypothetical protein
MASKRMSAALSVLKTRNFSKMFLRARRLLEFSHGLDPDSDIDPAEPFSKPTTQGWIGDDCLSLTVRGAGTENEAVTSSKKNPAAGGAGGGVFNGRLAEEVESWTEPSVATKMTRRREKWCVLRYRTS